MRCERCPRGADRARRGSSPAAMLITLAAATLCATTSIASPAHAQTVRAVVRDSATGGPVEGAIVALTAEGSTGWTPSAAAAGATLVVRVDRMGYVSWRSRPM